eukprot:GHVT01080722.1.p1 GENE.GHVT01080722.1~~GHVT01080722.1.p1  ORF type:complete len:689 (+),score=129.70 GHVT01080722.1:1452-3518(+)
MFRTYNVIFKRPKKEDDAAEIAAAPPPAEAIVDIEDCVPHTAKSPTKRPPAQTKDNLHGAHSSASEPPPKIKEQTNQLLYIKGANNSNAANSRKLSGNQSPDDASKNKSKLPSSAESDGTLSATTTAASTTIDSDDAAAVVEDVEQLAPIVRFKKKNKLSVTDLSSQIWCEQQLLFVLVTGKRRETEAMKAGTARHAVLESADHEVVDVEVTTGEESLALRLLNSIILLRQLQQTGKCREVWTFGIFEGPLLLRGVIDEVAIVTNPVTKKLETRLSDTKTRRERKEPSLAQKRTSANQLSVYRWMVEDLRQNRVDFNYLFQFYEVDSCMPFTIPELGEYRDLLEITAAFRLAFQQLPPCANEVEVVYECDGQEFSKNAIPYNQQSIEYTVKYLIDWWFGKRPADVPLGCERWKCRFCDFLGECSVTPLDARERDAQLTKRQEAADEEALIASFTGADSLVTKDDANSTSGSKNSTEPRTSQVPSGEGKPLAPAGSDQALAPASLEMPPFVSASQAQQVNPVSAGSRSSWDWNICDEVAPAPKSPPRAGRKRPVDAAARAIRTYKASCATDAGNALQMLGVAKSRPAPAPAPRPVPRTTATVPSAHGGPAFPSLLSERRGPALAATTPLPSPPPSSEAMSLLRNNVHQQQQTQSFAQKAKKPRHSNAGRSSIARTPSIADFFARKEIPK